MSMLGSKRRVVVTGLGAVTPLGTGLDKTWNAICAGQSGIARITRFDPTGYDAQIAGEVKDFDPAQFPIARVTSMLYESAPSMTAQISGDSRGTPVAEPALRA